jgi:catechol 2,3-dioxygenase-like lactoylglutathione lyase family enzyme
MQLRPSRAILFTSNMDKMVAFHRDVLGFKLKSNDKGWKAFDAGNCGGKDPDGNPFSPSNRS